MGLSDGVKRLPLSPPPPILLQHELDIQARTKDQSSVQSLPLLILIPGCIFSLCPHPKQGDDILKEEVKGGLRKEREEKERNNNPD